MTSSGKKRSAPVTDFKRTKAKVGKRAPKPINLTDTSFKAVSVDVRHQSVAAEKKNGTTTTTLVSSRGRTWMELTKQLHHPAAPVRISALRGLHDAIQLVRKQQLNEEEEAKGRMRTMGNGLLSSWLLTPVVKSACVDTDEQVRSMGYRVLEELVYAVENTTIDKDEKNPTDRLSLLWRPFLPLVIAFVTSALDSLDRRTRLDGCKLVQLLATRLYLHKEECVYPMLPPYVTLLTDHCQRMAKQQQKQQQQQQQQQQGNGRGGGGRRRQQSQQLLTDPLIILQSLVSLLRNSQDDSQHNASSLGNNKNLPEADLTVAANQTSSHCCALLITTGRPSSAAIHKRQSSSSMATLQDLGNCMAQLEEDPSSSSTRLVLSTSTSMPDPVMLSQLLSKLRDVHLEILQRGTSHLPSVGPDPIANNGFLKTRFDMEEATLTVMAMQQLWLQFPAAFLRQDKNNTTSAALTSILMESFPIRGQPTTDSLCNTLNAHVCLCLVERIDDNDDNSILNQLLEYLLPRLPEATPQESTMILMVVSRLLEKDSLQPNARKDILEQLATVYFHQDNTTTTTTTRPSQNQAVRLLCRLLAKAGYVIDTMEEIVQSMLLRLPSVLQGWSGAAEDNLEDSRLVLQTLHHVVRRTTPDSNMAVQLRLPVAEVLLLPSSSSRSSSSTTMLELYPRELQRLCIGLVVMLQLPPSNEAIPKALAKVCARSNERGDGLAAILLQQLHSIRRTTSMPAYLGFLLNSIGVPSNKVRKTTSKPLVDYMQSYDDATLQASHALIRCGTAKVVPRIAPVVVSWLQQRPPAAAAEMSANRTQKDQDDGVVSSWTRIRISTCLLSMLVLDMGNDCALTAIASCLKDPLVFAFHRVLASYPKDANDKSERERYRLLTQPMQVSAILSLV